MINLSLFLFIFGVIYLINTLVTKKQISLNKTTKILVISLFFVYMIRLFSNDTSNSVFNLLLIDITTPINSPDTWILGRSISIFMVFLRWFTVLTIIYLILNPFYKLKTIKIVSTFIAPIIVILNIIFFKENIMLFISEVNYLNYRSIQFMVEIILMGSLVGLNIIDFYKSRIRINFKEVYQTILIFLLSSLAVMPQSILFNLLGYYGEIPDGFNFSHNLLLLIPIVIIIISYFSLRNKTLQTRDFFIVFIAFAAFFQFFYVRRYGLTGLPLHLCNMAIVIMFISAIFRFKGLFYFNYFANVLGGIAALAFPDITEDLFVMGAMQYAFNHWYVILWPILAVALGVFDKPNLKHMYKAIIVLTIYYIFIVFINAWLNNYQSVDYFFVYRTHISEMFNLTGFQYDHIFSFKINDLTFTFYWGYQLLFYFSFILAMFGSWYVYDAFYRFAENQRKLRYKQKQMRIDELNLKQLLNGRNKSEPINLGGVDMIKIMNFSKRYGHSNDFAVKNFSLEVHKGEIFGFLGHNGAGKSTTIKSLVGIQSITEGTMEICGYSIKTQPLEAKLQIGYVSDNHALYEKLTGREYVMYVADLYNVDKELREERLEELIDQFNLRYAIDQEIKAYSHGMKQKLVVIAALIHEPPVWILDEPLTGLDPTSAYQIKESMKAHAKKGNIVFFSSHVIEVVEKICDRIAIITKGELQGIYDMNEIRENNVSLEELYMSKIRIKGNS